MAGTRGFVTGSAWALLLALSACSNQPGATPTSPRDTGLPGVDLQIRGVVEFVPPGSSEEPPAPTCDGQPDEVADCVAANLDAEQIVLVGAEPGGGTYVLGPVIVDGSDVQDAAAASTSMGSEGWVVQVQLTPSATSAFADATTTLAGQKIAIVVDGRVLSAPTVQVPITSGALQVAGLTEAEARSMATHLIPPIDASP